MRRTTSLLIAVAVMLVLVVQVAAGLLDQQESSPEPRSAQEQQVREVSSLERESPQEDEVRVFFEPALGVVAPDTTVRMMVDAPSDEIVYLYVQLAFDHTKLNLSEEIQITGPFSGTRKTGRDGANASGRIVMMLTLPAEDFGAGPIGTYELASFDLHVVTDEPDVALGFPAVEPFLHVVDVEALDVVAEMEPASLVLNPAPCGSPAADHCVDLGAPDDEAYHNLTGWSIMQEDSLIIPPTGDTTKRHQLLQGDSSLTLTVPQAGAQYLLLTEVEDGGCDDSFEIYINDQGPVYSYQDDPELSGAGVTHMVLIPGELVSTTEVLVTYRNIASDSCGYAAVFNSKMIPFDPRATHGNPAVVYVDRAATGAATGDSWEDAHTTLQDALVNAHPGDEIWVATGVYTPGLARTDTFTLSPGVAIYGGFPTGGGDGTFEARDWGTHLTVLSGDLDGNDGTDANGVVTDTANITGTNAYHVVISSGVAETAVLDGFIITAGNAEGTGSAQRDGGGMYNETHSSPTLNNLSFCGNRAEYGGGMYNETYSSPTLTNVIFSGNHAEFWGGGMRNNLHSSPRLANVVFGGNHAEYHGGGMANHESSPTLINVTFSGNQALGGGGMFNSYSSPTLVNAVVWGNSPDSMLNDDNSNPAITYSDVEWSGDGYAGTGNINADPSFVGPVPASEAPTTAGDYRLRYDSPAIDAGNTLSVTVSTDLDGNPRVVGEDVDIGAYESQELKVYLPLVIRAY